MNFDDIARVIGYITIGWWALVIILMIIMVIFGKTATVKSEGFRIMEKFLIKKKEPLTIRGDGLIPRTK